jgi:hypothetical protein
LDKSIASPQGFPASRTHVLVNEKGRKTNDTYGPNFSESFAWLDRTTSSWKTYQVCFQSTGELSSGAFSQTWPQAGMMRNGISYRLPVLAHRTSEEECSLWRTPMAQEAGARIETRFTKDGQPAKVSERAYRKQRDGRMVLQSQTLGQQVRYSTPQSRDFRTGQASRWDNPNRSRNLNDQIVKMWPAPKASDAVMGMTANCSDRPAEKSTHLQAQVAIRENWKPNQNSGKLSTIFVEWLMGYEIGYTDLEA